MIQIKYGPYSAVLFETSLEEKSPVKGNCVTKSKELHEIIAQVLQQYIRF